TITQSVFVNGGAPLANFTLQNASLCSNKNVVLVDASSVDFGNLVKLEIYWDFGNDPTIKTIDNAPQAGRTYSHTYPEFGSPASQNYTVRYVAYSGTNCVNTLSRTVTLLATPTLQFSPVTPVCANVGPFQITEAQLVNVLPGSGVFSGTGVDAAGLFTPSVSGAGSFIIRYTYTGNNTCVNYIEQSVAINPMPGANAGPDKVVIQGGTVTLTPATNANMPVNYQWTPITGLNNPAQPFVIVSSVTGDVTYTLTVTSDKGCVSTDQVTVKYLKNPVVPNIFSPNGDGTHDNWDIDFLASYPGCTVEIYNRYGQLVFKSIGYSTPWNGTINGKPAAIGTYYYIIDPKNQAKIMTGYVDIVR
ncbi:MAG TPA: gliding motility-associated C-terminal domain-containing protein, partial [Chitinophagaceae bacterium]|nr:gliding motility-associated C-terminal domain-containing protein [Chitinophagaceae bacterium]